MDTHIGIIDMKWNIITHNIHGLNDPDSIAKKWGFINSLLPRADIVMIQQHKLRAKLWTT